MWLTEHGKDYMCPTLPKGWTDVSWKNDSCPCFKGPARIIRLDTKTRVVPTLWVEHPLSKFRACPQSRRFYLTLTTYDMEGEELHEEVVYDGDDEVRVLELCEQMEGNK